MPVRFNIADSETPVYLIPAPFVNINKTFDKQGDGEILGSRYTIQLDGYLVADRGSPKTNGTFIADGVDVVDGNVNHDGTDGKTGFYESLQAKQKAISNLISKLQSGGLLEVQHLDTSKQGFSAHVRLESVDLPCHDPGDPYKSKYTINLSCDYLLGPMTDVGEDINNDEDDWHRQDKWLISAATESYQVEETERFYLDRQANDESDSTSGDGQKRGEINRADKTYTITRTISATGKNKFDRETNVANGLETDGFTGIYAKDGRAWQQARGFVYDIVKYGNQFIFGRDNLEYPYTDALSLPKGSTLPRFGAGEDTKDNDDYHIFSLNLPTVTRLTEDGITAAKAADQAYKTFNYKRMPSIDVKSGTFTVTETFTLAPSITLATETVEISTSESEGEDGVEITISGTIEGVLDNSDDLAVGNIGNEDKDVERLDPVSENLDFATEGKVKDTNSKYQNALLHFNKSVDPKLKQTAEAIARKTDRLSSSTISSSPLTRNVTHQPTQGIITYNVSYKATRVGSGGNNLRYIPYVQSEEISINDTYPGQSFAEQLVLGRKLGPVLQNIGTQTHWQREVTISCKVNVTDPHICVDHEDDITGAGTYDSCVEGECSGYEIPTDGDGEPLPDPDPQTRSECEKYSGTWTLDGVSCADQETEGDPHTTRMDCIHDGGKWSYGSPEWIANPNFAGIGTSNTSRSEASENALQGSISQGRKTTTNLITSKPGYSIPTSIVGSTEDNAASLGNRGARFGNSANMGIDDDFASVIKTGCTNATGTDNPDLGVISCHWPKYKQFIGIKKLLNSLDPMTYIGDEYTGEAYISENHGGNRHVTKRFTNAPQESWNPKNGEWSYSISWVYELGDPYTTFSSSFFDSAFVDELVIPNDASKGTSELLRTSPGQYF